MINNLWAASSAALLLYCVATTVIASTSERQPASPLDKPAERYAPTMVVTATRTLQTLEDSLASVIVLDRKQIAQANATSLPELLSGYPGLELASNGGPGQTSSLFLRGTNSNHTVVLIDGIKINPGVAGGASLQNIDPAIIERIEIVKGPQSILYGSDAIGGVINIITQQPSFKPHAKVAGRAGTEDYYSLSASGGFGSEERGFKGQVGYLQTRAGGFPTTTNSRVDAAYTNRTLTTGLAQQTELGELRYQLWHAEGVTDYINPFTDPNRLLSQDYLNSINALSLASSPTSRWFSTLRLGQAIDRIEQRQSTDHLNTRRYNLDWQNDLSLTHNQQLTLGLQVEHQKVRARSFGLPFGENTTRYEIYGQDEISWGDQQLIVGARASYEASYGQQTTWQLAYGYQLTSSTKVYSRVATGFRAPNATDKFGFGGNPDLKPERSLNYELGLRQQLTRQQHLEAAAFYHRIRDLIQFANSRVENIGRAQITGLEISHYLQLSRLNWRNSFVLQNPKDKDTGKGLLNRAKQRFTSQVNYQVNQFNAGAEWQLVGRRLGFAADMGGYSLVNLTAGYQVSQPLLLNARIDNVFDKQYATNTVSKQVDYRSQGFAVKLGFEYSWF
jgi:vitamin B12 transporter